MKVIFKILVFILFTWVISTWQLFAQKQNLDFKHITVEDGLTQSWARCILQDKYGYIWIGTNDGLNKYDGYEIVNYKHNPRDKNTISNNTITKLVEDSRGNLWIGTAKGINLYDRERNIFVKDSASSQVIVSITEDASKNLLICTYTEVLRYNYKTKLFSEYFPEANVINSKYKDFIRDAYIREIIFDKKGNTWFASNSGVCLFLKETNKFINYYHKNDDPKSLGNNLINSIYEDYSGRIWVAHDDGLDLFLNPGVPSSKACFRHFKNKKDDPESISLGIVKTIIEYNKDQLWVGVDNGGLNILKIGEKIEDKFTHYWHKGNQPKGLSNSSIQSLFVDRQNNIWVGTYGNGVNLHTPYTDNFELFRNEFNNNESLSSNQVNAFLEDGDFIWIGTEKGLNKFDKRDNTFICYTHNPNDNTSIGSDAVWAIHKDKSGYLWLGTWSGGLNKFDIKTEKFTHYYFNPSDSTSISSNNIFAIFEDSDGYLWLATNGGGLNMFDRTTKKFTRYNESNSPIYRDYIESVIEDKDGDLWIANVQSIEKFNRKTKKFQNYLHDEKDSTSISGTIMFLVFRDSKSNIWIGTDIGLNLYQPKTDNFKSFQIQDGLPDNAIKSITEDRFGNLWIGTNKGLSKFIGAVDLHNEPKFKNYVKEDGLQNNEFNRRSCLTSSDGLIYFGGENGFVRFDPAKMPENTNIPNIVFTDFLLFNKPVPVGEKDSPLSHCICETKSITLTHEQSVYTIRFVALNYVIPEKNQYAYIMQGFEKNWNYVGNKREATYTNLPPGTYTFRVKASNNDGIWNETGTSIEIIMLPPWWGTWWFKTILLLTIILCIIFIVVKIINRIKQSAHQTILTERNQLKTLINNIPDRIIIKDIESHFIVLNDAAIKHWGGNNELDFINKTDYDFHTKEIADSSFKEDLEILKTGKPILNQEDKRYKDGQEIIISTIKCPIINPKKETIGLLCIIKDITEQKNAEQKIIKQSKQLQKYNEALSETNVLLEERQQEIEEKSEELIAQAETLKRTNSLLIENQQLIQQQADELTKNNKELLILNATKDKFFSIIAHDLRNPFNTIIGFSEILLVGFKKFTPEKTEKYLGFIYNLSINVNDLLNNLLSWSQSQTGTISFSPVKLNFAQIVDDTIKLLEGSAQKKNITLQKTLDKETNCLADANMMNTVIRNLISNAIKFTPEKGVITIKAEVSNKELLVTVSDTGVGISKENQKKLFRIDTNISTKGTTNETGTGLGLILCKEFIEKQSGKIWIESEVGKGSEFKFTLPLY